MTDLQLRSPRRPGTASEDAPPFEAFFRANYLLVVRLAHGVVGDGQAAQDVAQEVFLAAYRRFPDDYDKASGWVRLAAVHTALNQLRSERRRARRLLPLPGNGALPSAEEVAIGHEERAELRGALRRIPVRSATVLVMRHTGLSYAEIADALGVPIANVGTLLRRAEAALRKEMTHATRS